MINWSQGLLELGQDVINLICNEKAQRLDIKTNDSGTIEVKPGPGYMKGILKPSWMRLCGEQSGTDVGLGRTLIP